MKLSKTEWETLDGLLEKSGFGEYYDLMECLFTILDKTHPKGHLLVEKMRVNNADLHTVITVMMLTKNPDIILPMEG